MSLFRRELLVKAFLCILALAATSVSAHGKRNVSSVEYDGRSLIINGKRQLLFSGSIHYPRSTPEMWPKIIAKAKQGGLNVIQTYVFWNLHEPQRGQFNFQGRNDLVKFIKLIHAQGLYVTLRIGPFIEAEWNFGGFPFWLKEVENITFRTDNPPFKYHMKTFTKMIVNMMKNEKLFLPQGGPIILAQIENEYNNVALAFKEDGSRYVQWAGKMAVSLKTGVPWIMCKQKDAPDPVINSCNGRNCGDTFTGPNKPHKPVLWTENWTAQYRVFGDPPSQRSAEDLAYSVARFFSKNGTLTNYYMYYGGTNFGRTGSSFAMTRYYDEAPIDEFGLKKEPKWGHLRDLHKALKLSQKALLWGTNTAQNLGEDLEARVYQKEGTPVCAAFLTNTNPRIDKIATFRGVDYFLPHRSISILPDCKTEIYNTQRVNSQHSARTYHLFKQASQNPEWMMFQEAIPTVTQTHIKADKPLELMNLTKDTTDYVWYTTSFNLEDEDLPMRRDIRPVIQVSSLGHALHGFVNDVYIGSAHGTHIDKSFSFSKPANLKAGTNHISLLGMTIGLPDSGALLERRIAGVHRVVVQGLNTGTLDLSANVWGHEVGMVGEKLRVYNQRGSHRVQWTKAKKNSPVTWYKMYFDAPHGNDPVAIDMGSMGKGMVWINGESIGRYWVSYLSPLGKSSQSMYHVPRAFLRPKGNLMVVFEETMGNPEEITFVTVRRDNKCSVVSEFHPARVTSWARENSHVHAVVEDVKPRAQLKCDEGKVVNSVVFASFGNPGGACGNLTVGSCHAPATRSVVEKACLGKTTCMLPVKGEAYGADPDCPGTTSTLAVQVKCSRRNSKQ
ncbi:beta-galactosidase 11-like [Wolffia australiana]